MSRKAGEKLGGIKRDAVTGRVAGGLETRGEERKRGGWDDKVWGCEPEEGEEGEEAVRKRKLGSAAPIGKVS